MTEGESYGHTGVVDLVILDLDSMSFNTIITTHTIILSWWSLSTQSSWLVDAKKDQK